MKQRGTIKWFSKEKGYGFIQAEEDEEYFFHQSQFEGEGHPDKGQKVEFVVGAGKKGPMATNVSRMDD